MEINKILREEGWHCEKCQTWNVGLALCKKCHPRPVENIDKVLKQIEAQIKKERKKRWN